MQDSLKQEFQEKFPAQKRYRVAVIALAVLVLLLFLIMQVRVGDKDNRIGDLQAKVDTQTEQINEFRAERKQFLIDADANADAYADLAELQRTTVEWGNCLTDWGNEIAAGIEEVTATKIRCDTILVEMSKKAGG